jgi:hypothetical protein
MQGFSSADAMELMFSDVYQFEQLYKKFSTMAAELHTCTHKFLWIDLPEIANSHGARNYASLVWRIRKDMWSVWSCGSSVLSSLFLCVRLLYDITSPKGVV